MKGDNINIAFCISRDYLPYICVTIKSIECNYNGNINIHIFYIDENEIEEKHVWKYLQKKDRVKFFFYNVDDTKIKDIKGGSKFVWMRLLIPELISHDIHKVLYLDADTIVNDNLSELFEISLDGHSIASTIDCITFFDETFVRCEYPKEKEYICAGVIIINLDFWREQNLTDKCIQWAIDHPYIKLHDQDTINNICQDTKLLLPIKYGLMEWLFEMKDLYSSIYRDQIVKSWEKPTIIHYAGAAPWFKDVIPSVYGYIWFEYNSKLKMSANRKYRAKGLIKLKIMLKRFLTRVKLSPKISYNLIHDNLRNC